MDLAESVVDAADLFPRIFNCLKDTDINVRKNSAACIREIAKQNPTLAKLIVNPGGAPATVDHITEARANVQLPGSMTSGHIPIYE